MAKDKIENIKKYIVIHHGKEYEFDFDDYLEMIEHCIEITQDDVWDTALIILRCEHFGTFHDVVIRGMYLFHNIIDKCFRIEPIKI